MEKPKILTSEVLSGEYFNVQKDLLERPDGQKTTYSHCVLKHDAAVVLALTPDGKFVLNREYRHPTGKYLLGLPGGTLIPGEDPVAGGLREFHEETGYWSDEAQLLASAYPLPAICNQKIFYILAKNARLKGAQSLDPFEYIHPELKTEAEIKDLLHSKTIVDGLLLTALSLYSLLSR